MIFAQTDKNINFLQLCSPEKVTASSGQSIEYMLNPCCASMEHVVMHSV